MERPKEEKGKKKLRQTLVVLVNQGSTAIPLLPVVSPFTVSVTHGQLWPENIKWKVPEINN